MCYFGKCLVQCLAFAVVVNAEENGGTNIEQGLFDGWPGNKGIIVTKMLDVADSCHRHNVAWQMT